MKKPRLNAFSLVEVIVVMLLMAVFIGLVLPSTQSMLRGSHLSQAGGKVIACLSFARQMALAKNHSVEVRFYQITESGNPQGNAGWATGSYRAIQLFEIDDHGKATAISKCELLPQNVIIDAGSTLSSLLGSSQSKSWNSDGDSQISLPRVGTNYGCRAFRYFSDGSASPAKSGTLWFFTLHTLQDGDNRTTPPANYVTIQIDPANGSLKVWRP